MIKGTFVICMTKPLPDTIVYILQYGLKGKQCYCHNRFNVGYTRKNNLIKCMYLDICTCTCERCDLYT